MKSTKHKYDYEPEPYQDYAEGWWQKRRRGYGMNLYRNTKEKKIAGICSGLADHLNVDHWVIRLATFGAFIFFNMLAVWAYIVAWICLSPKPKGRKSSQRYRYDEYSREDRPVNMFRYQMSTSERLRIAKVRANEVANRISKMERYVTSSRFELDKEFSKIQK